MPIIQCIGAAALLQLGYADRGVDVAPARMVCQAIHAPALLFRFLNPYRLGPPFNRLPGEIFGFYTDDLFFLAGVIVVWSFIGHAIDHRRSVIVPRKRRLVIALIVNLSLLAFGIFLLVGALPLSKRQLPFDYYGPGFGRALLLLAWNYHGFFFLAWAAGIIFFCGRAFISGCVRYIALGRSESVE